MSTRRSTRTATRSLRARVMALALALLFLLQSAAQAGSGCLSSVLAGGCCCAVAEVAPEPALAPEPTVSCCSSRAEPRTEEMRAGVRADLADGPRVTQPDACACDVAPAEHVPADRSCGERARDPRGSLAHDGFSSWIAHSVAAGGPCAQALPHLLGLACLLGPPGPPPRTSPTLATTRLAHRGVIGLLSELCTVRW